MLSRIKMDEKVENKERTFGSNPVYYPARVTLEDGTEKNALFTEGDVIQAVQRADRNPEDVPGKSFWDYLLGDV